MKQLKYFPSKLEDKTRELLENAPRKLTQKKIAHDTGLSMPWVSDFANKRLKHVSAGRLEALYNYLSPKPLEF